MAKIKDDYIRNLAEKLPKYDQLVVIGMLVWLKWCEDLHLPLPALKSPAIWTEFVWFLVGVAESRYYFLSQWWQEKQIRWVLRMIAVEDMFRDL